MFLFRSHATMPRPDEALPGRSQAMPIPARHYVNGAALAGPWPDGTRTAIFAFGCFWGAEKDFWETPGVVAHRRRLRRRLHAEPHVRRGLHRPDRPRRGRARRLRPASVSYEQLLKVFWEHHDPTQGMRQGNDIGTQYRSAIFYATDEEQRQSPRRHATPTRSSLTAAGYGTITTEIATGRPVLLRRGLPPAVPREEPRRLLPEPRHRREAARRLRGDAARSTWTESNRLRRRSALILWAGDLTDSADGQRPHRCRRSRSRQGVLHRTGPQARGRDDSRRACRSAA